MLERHGKKKQIKNPITCSLLRGGTIGVKKKPTLTRPRIRKLDKKLKGKTKSSFERCRMNPWSVTFELKTKSAYPNRPKPRIKGQMSWKFEWGNQKKKDIRTKCCVISVELTFKTQFEKRISANIICLKRSSINKKYHQPL